MFCTLCYQPGCDQLALYRQRCGLPALSINWGPWADAGIAMDNIDAVFDKSDFIKTKQGMALMPSLLSNKYGQMAIVPVKYMKFMLDFVPEPIPEWLDTIRRNLPEIQQELAVDAKALIAKLSELTPKKRLAEIEAIVSTATLEVLGIDDKEDIRSEQGFFEMGMDSMMAVELQKRISSALGNAVELKANLAFDYPNVYEVTPVIPAKAGIQAFFER